MLEAGQRPQQLAIAIGLAPRKVGKADLDLTAAEFQAAQDVRPGLDPGGWSVDQTARILLVLASAGANRDAFAESVERVFAAAEIGEQIALLRGLPLLPDPERLMPYAAEGIRSAMQPSTPTFKPLFRAFRLFISLMRCNTVYSAFSRMLHVFNRTRSASSALLTGV